MMHSLAAQKTHPALTQDRAVSIVALQIAACLVLRFALAFTSSPEALQEMAFLALAVPAFLFKHAGLFDARLFHRTIAAAFLYLLPVILSFIFNLATMEGDIGYAAIILCNLVALFFFGAFFASCRDDDIWLRVIYYLAPLAVPFFIYVAIDQRHAYEWGRWQPYGDQPNWWGMMGLGLAWAALAWQQIVPRFVFLGIAAMFMFLTQARGSILALIPAVFFASGYFIPLNAKKMLRLVVIGAATILAIGVISVATSHNILASIFDFFINDILRVNDPERGLGSGLSGRTEAYATALQAFEQSPLFGSGYGQFGFVHNGFLLTLAESGIFALLGMLALFFWSLSGYIKHRQWPGIGIVTSYIFLLMTFPRSFNINMTSLIFILVLMRGVALNSLASLSPVARRPLIGPDTFKQGTGA